MSVVDSLVEVRLKNAEDFLKIKETLSRIGVASKKDKTLYQSCHILHKQGKYYITHFKELFLLDGKSSDFDEGDRGRRNTIVKLLEEWGLLEVISKDKIVEPQAALSQIKIIAFKEKDEWTLVPKYTIGKKRTV
jgi:Bacteriophage translational regulator